MNEEDLQLFKDKIEKEDQPHDVGVWEPMMDKDFGDFTYTAWRRKLPVSPQHHLLFWMGITYPSFHQQSPDAVQSIRAKRPE